MVFVQSFLKSYRHLIVLSVARLVVPLFSVSLLSVPVVVDYNASGIVLHCIQRRVSPLCSTHVIHLSLAARDTNKISFFT